MAALRQLHIPRELGEGGRRPPATFDADRMKRIFEKVAGNPVKGEEQPAPQGKYELAYGRLERAATVFDLLISRCQQLETQVKDTVERAKAEFASRDQTIAELEQRASQMQARAEEANQRLEALKAQSEATEARTAMAKAASDAAAATAKDLSMELHDKLIAALALCSRTHVSLESVAAMPAVDQGSSAT